MNNNLATVEAACRDLAAAGHPITFTTIAERTGISRTTLYRNHQLRAVIEEHRHHSHDPRTLTGLTTEIAHLRTAVQASPTESATTKNDSADSKPPHAAAKPTEIPTLKQNPAHTAARLAG